MKTTIYLFLLIVIPLKCGGCKEEFKSVPKNPGEKIAPEDAKAGTKIGEEGSHTAKGLFKSLKGFFIDRPEDTSLEKYDREVEPIDFLKNPSLYNAKAGLFKIGDAKKLKTGISLGELNNIIRSNINNANSMESNNLVKVLNLEKIDIVISFPSDKKQFETIFGRVPSELEYAQIAPLASQVDRYNPGLEHRPSLADGVWGDGYNHIQSLQSPSDLQMKFGQSLTERHNIDPNLEYKNFQKSLIIIGHNDKGDFYFPNGESINLSQISHIKSGYDRVIVLSCFANKYHESGPAISFRLSYEESFLIAAQLVLGCINNDGLSDKEINKSLDEAGGRIGAVIMRGRLAKLGIGGGIAFAIYELHDQ